MYLLTNSSMLIELSVSKISSPSASASISTQEVQIKTLKERVTNLQLERDQQPGKYPGKKAPKYDGLVVKVNYDYNYLIISYEQNKDHLL